MATKGDYTPSFQPVTFKLVLIRNPIQMEPLSTLFYNSHLLGKIT